MSDHERIDELLAGYVLRTVSGEDAAETDRLLSEHVPGCAACRATLAGFQAVSGDLGLATPSMTPPDTLLPRLRRDIDAGSHRRVRRWRPIQLLAAAASIVVVVGLGGLAITQGMSASDARQRVAKMQGALDFAGRPGTDATQVGPVTEFSARGVEEFWIYGTDVAPPPAAMIYRVWMVDASGGWVCAGDFVPDDGLVSLHGTYDASRYDRIVITVEPAGSAPGTPGEVLWQRDAA